MKKVLITLPLGEKRLAAINQHISAECIPGIKDAYEETLEIIENYEGLLVLGGVRKVDSNLLVRATKLKIISNYGVGYDKIDVNYCKEKNIIVSNTPHAVTAPTAELAFGLILDLCRRISVSDRAARNKTTNSWYNSQLPSTSIEGKTLGIIGMGRIGKAVAKRAIAFGMKIVYYQRNRLSADIEESYNATYLSLTDLLKQVDILSLHLPLTPATRHLIGAKELALLKSSALLINTARGSIVDEAALIKALQEQKIAGAGLDVFDQEPNIPEAFLEMEQVVLTPHIGTASKEARANMFDESIESLVEFFNGKAVTNRVV